MNTLIQPEEMEEALTQTAQRLQENLERWTQRGSAWGSNHGMNLHVKYRPLSNLTIFFPLPLALWATKAIVILQHYVDHYLRWSLSAALLPIDKNLQRTIKYHFNDN